MIGSISISAERPAKTLLFLRVKETGTSRQGPAKALSSVLESDRVERDDV
jgi:hypothetical protein